MHEDSALRTIEQEHSVKAHTYAEKYQLPPDLSADSEKLVDNTYTEYNRNVDRIQHSTDVAFLTTVLKDGPDSLRLVAAEQLLTLGRSGQKHFAEDVVACGGLGTLARWFLCSHHALRMKCAALCGLLYKGSVRRQDLFIEVNGHFKLVQLLAWNSTDTYACRKILKYIRALLLDDKRQMRVYIGQKLYDAMLYDVLKQCQQVPHGDKVLRQLENLRVVVAKSCSSIN